MNATIRVIGSIVLGVLTITGATSTNAGVTTFTDRTEWHAAIGSSATTVIDFDGFPLFTPISTQYVASGVEFLPDGGLLPFVQAGQTKTLDSPLGLNLSTKFQFLTPVSAVGWDRTSADDSHIYSIFDVSGRLLATFNLPTPTMSGGPIFGGFVSDVAIGSASSFSYNDDQRHSIDNLEFAVAVPEPETYAMLLAGLGLLGFTGRRRKRK